MKDTNDPSGGCGSARRRLLKTAAIGLPLLVTLKARPIQAGVYGSTAFYDYAAVADPLSAADATDQAPTRDDQANLP